MKRFIIYHDGADGRCAAAIAGRAARATGFDQVYIQADFGEDPPWGILGMASRVDELWILDIAFPEDAMWALVMRFPGLVWMDHNACSIEVLEFFDPYIDGIRDPNMTAAFATWHFIYAGVRAPLPVLFISDHHLGAFSLEDDTRRFMAAYQDKSSLETRPASGQWDTWLGCRQREQLQLDLDYGELLLSLEALNKDMAAINAAKEAYKKVMLSQTKPHFEVVS